MRIGLVSDTHNDQKSLRQALERLRLESINSILHAGDVASGMILRLIAGFDVWVARGNMDHDPMMFRVSQELFGPGHFRQSHTLQLNGASVALVHNVDCDTARAWISSGDYDYVIHGHTHQPRDERIGAPGAQSGSLPPRGP